MFEWSKVLFFVSVKELKKNYNCNWNFIIIIIYIYNKEEEKLIHQVKLEEFDCGCNIVMELMFNVSADELSLLSLMSNQAD